MGKVGTGPLAVVKEYTSGNWRVREWASGLKECWFYGFVTFSELIGSGLPDMKVMKADVSLPIQFSATPCAVASCDWGISEWVQATPSTGSVGIRKFAVGGNSQNIKRQNVSIYVSGV